MFKFTCKERDGWGWTFQTTDARKFLIHLYNRIGNKLYITVEVSPQYKNFFKYCDIDPSNKMELYMDEYEHDPMKISGSRSFETEGLVDGFFKALMSNLVFMKSPMTYSCVDRYSVLFDLYTDKKSIDKWYFRLVNRDDESVIIFDSRDEKNILYLASEFFYAMIIFRLATDQHVVLYAANETISGFLDKDKDEGQ